MRPIRRAGLFAAVFVVAAVSPVAAQDEAALKSFFEGRRVTVRIDMPGTQEGVNVFPERNGQMNLPDYRSNLRQYGVSIRAGDTVVVTLVKVKKDLVEFQLAGGGYGTFGDDTSADVYIPLVEKSDREKDLEHRIHDEDDEHERRRMQRELDELRERRERENRRIEAERERRSALKAQQIAEARLHGGSRFNLRWDRVPADLTPGAVMAALTEYVDFEDAPPHAVPAPPLPPPPAVPAAGDLSALRKGMTRAEAEQLFGRPAQVSDHRDGSLLVTTLVFVSGDQRLAADFVEGVLVRYTITSK